MLGIVSILKAVYNGVVWSFIRLGTELAQYAAYTQRVVTAARGPIDAAIDHIARCVTAIWPQATVTRFGSFATGLWLPSSDVDVVVLGVLDVVDSADAIADGVAALEAIARGLRGQRDWVKRIDVVRGAKVPVAKLELQARGLHVDISIENGHTHRGIEASTLVRRYVRELPLLRPLVLALKQFLREKALNDAFTGGLSSYAVTLLAVFLLEHEPTDAMDQPVKDEDAKGSGTELGRALLDFLEFYGLGFCYATTGISLRPEAFGEYLLAPLMAGLPMMPQLVIDDPVYSNGQHNAAAGAFAIARVIAALENAHYALRFHRPTRFTPSPLCQLLHWSGHDTPGGGSAKPQL